MDVFSLPEAQLDLPVLLITFNRPRYVERLIGVLRAVKPSTVLIAIDGPRRGSQDSTAIQEILKLVGTIDWTTDVRVLQSETNRGCGRAPAAAIDWLFEQFEFGAIVEDDCIPDPTFFPFVAEMLQRYKDDLRIGMVAGENPGLTMMRDSSYGFSRFSYIACWATWRRAWQAFDFDLKIWPEVRASGVMEALFPDPRAYHFWTSRLERVHRGEETTVWDYQWCLTNWLNDRLCIVPWKNLFSNVGSESDATHTRGFHHHLHRETEPMPFPLSHPPFIVADHGADEVAERERFSTQPMLKRVIGRIDRELRYRGVSV